MTRALPKVALCIRGTFRARTSLLLVPGWDVLPCRPVSPADPGFSPPPRHPHPRAGRSRPLPLALLPLFVPNSTVKQGGQVGSRQRTPVTGKHSSSRSVILRCEERPRFPGRGRVFAVGTCVGSPREGGRVWSRVTARRRETAPSAGPATVLPVPSRAGHRELSRITRSRGHAHLQGNLFRSNKQCRR